MEYHWEKSGVRSKGVTTVPLQRDVLQPTDESSHGWAYL